MSLSSDIMAVYCRHHAKRVDTMRRQKQRGFITITVKKTWIYGVEGADESSALSRKQAMGLKEYIYSTYCH
jgi:hypothetical protein